MENEVERLYLRGDTKALLVIARRAGSPAEDGRGAFRALRLLARMGDQEAITFCDAANGGHHTLCDAAA